MAITADFLASHWAHIVAGDFQPENLQDLFLARVAAFFRLADPELSEKAKAFLLSTMTISEADYDFPRRTAFVAQIETVGNPDVVCVRDDDALSALVFKISYKTVGDSQEKYLHAIAFFDEKKRFTRQYNLHELSAQTTPPDTLSIRQIHDEILHHPAETITDFSSPDIQVQIDVLKRDLYATGGAGIAANQSLEIENPLSIILAGTDYAHPEHTAKVITRYPGVLFMPMECYLNPRVIWQSDELVLFREGCLSVQGVTRAQVLRPNAVTVEHEDLSGVTHQKKFTGADARVMLHELDHINNGNVYFQHVLNDLSTEQLEALIKVTQQAITENDSVGIANPFETPILLFKRNATGQLEFIEAEVLEVFKKIPIETLEGVLAKTEEALRVKLSIAGSSERKRSPTVIELVSKPADIDQVAASDVLVESFIGEYQKYLKPCDISAELTSWREGDQSVEQYYKNYFATEFADFARGDLHYWVQATVDGKLVGWATFQREKTDLNSVYMNLLVVHPHYQGKGIGTKLVFSLMNLNVLPDLHAVHLLLRRKNEGGRIFYSKLGFNADSTYHREDNFVDLELLEGWTWRNPALQNKDTLHAVENSSLSTPPPLVEPTLASISSPDATIPQSIPSFPGMLLGSPSLPPSRGPRIEDAPTPGAPLCNTVARL